MEVLGFGPDRTVLMYHSDNVWLSEFHDYKMNYLTTVLLWHLSVMTHEHVIACLYL
jgi:hypothetical protein